MCVLELDNIGLRIWTDGNQGIVCACQIIGKLEVYLGDKLCALVGYLDFVLRSAPAFPYLQMDTIDCHFSASLLDLIRKIEKDKSLLYGSPVFLFT